MLRKPRPGRRVEIVRGSLQGLRGTVVDASPHHHGRKVTLRLDPPATWSGHSQVRLRRRKLRATKVPAPAPRPQVMSMLADDDVAALVDDVSAPT